jgi:hypothetical protein
MTPQEKAKELVNKFRPYTKIIVADAEYIEDTKKCALIAVDELIKEARFSSVYIEEVFFTTGYYDKQDYWQEVKQEIENL